MCVCVCRSQSPGRFFSRRETIDIEAPPIDDTPVTGAKRKLEATKAKPERKLPKALPAPDPATKPPQESPDAAAGQKIQKQAVALKQRYLTAVAIQEGIERSVANDEAYSWAKTMVISSQFSEAKDKVTTALAREVFFGFFVVNDMANVKAKYGPDLVRCMQRFTECLTEPVNHMMRQQTRFNKMHLAHTED